MSESSAVSAALEDYLEIILRLLARKGSARVRDVAEALSVHKSTVSVALRRLAENGLVNYRPYELVSLTPRGEALGREVFHRHQVIRRFLIEVLLIDEGQAEANACRIEHVIDAEVLDRMSRFLEFARHCPECGMDPLGAFGRFCAHGDGKAVESLRRAFADLEE
ncbi:MAG: metal-dependent transcriptional regulator [Phycisphaerae bacterium]|nr:metal-dependent transcriptional regulator [Phycisphaerae bacterium]